MNKRKTYLILGLGIFGSTISKELVKYNQDVIAIDSNMELVEDVSQYVSHAVCCDFQDIDQLIAVGIENVDVAIVATGSHLEASIFAIMNLKQLGVPYVLAKAKDDIYGEILKKVGADKIIMPEKETGMKIARSLLAWNIVELFDIDKDYSIMEIKVPNSWVNKTLIDLNLRKKFGINVIGIRSNGNNHLSVNPSPTYKIQGEDQFLVVADKEIFNHYEDLEKVSN